MNRQLKIIDWIFSGEDLEFLSKKDVEVFIQDRFNKALFEIGIEPMFEVDLEQLGESAKWFEEERVLDVRVDFFDVQSPNYTIGQQDISAESLF